MNIQPARSRSESAPRQESLLRVLVLLAFCLLIAGCQRGPALEEKEITIEPAVRAYGFFQHMLAWSIVAAVLGFVTFPWGMIAYKIWQGNEPIDEELKEELLQRSWRYGWALGGAALVFVLLDYFIIKQFELPAGPIHIVFYIAFLSLAGWRAMHYYSMEDFFQGLILALIYLYLPALVLYILWFIINWNPLFTYVLSWLPTPTA